MNHPSADSPVSAVPDPQTPAGPAPATRQRLRLELLLCSVWLALGLFALPAAIFGVGMLLLGPYGLGAGVGRFYADFFADLAGFSARAWALALGPLVLITLLRLTLVRRRHAPPAPEADTTPRNPSPARARDEARRIEPRIGGE